MKMKILMLMLVVLMLVVGCSEKVADTPKVVETKTAPAISGAAVVTTPPKVVETTPVVEPVKTETTVSKPVAVAEPTNKIIKVTDTGFVPSELAVKVGDTVEWQNTRVGSIDKMLIVGTQSCSDIKSAILESGKSYTYTFDKADTCTIVEAITTTQVGKVVIS